MAARRLYLLQKEPGILRHVFKYKFECIKSLNEAISREGNNISDFTISKVVLLVGDDVSSRIPGPG